MTGNLYWNMCMYLSGLKKISMSESSSDIMELEEGTLFTHPEITKKSNCNPRHNNNINPACMSIETDVWLLSTHCKFNIHIILDRYRCCNRYSYFLSGMDYSEGDGGSVVAVTEPVVKGQLHLPTVPDVGLLHPSS